MSSRAYYYTNREEILKKKKEYYTKNKKEINRKSKISGKKWYQRNKKKIRAKHKEWYQLNKETRKEYSEKYYQKNKEKISERNKNYYQKNKEKVQLRHREYNKRNKDRLLEYKEEWQKTRRKINPRWRLDENIGVAVWSSLKNKKAGKKWEHFVGYNLDQLIEHLEKMFDKKMNWENYGSYWSVDHIKPKTLFKYKSANDIEFKQCWDLKNLQPLEKIENIKKGNRYIS